MMGGSKTNTPKLLVDNATRKIAPFYDGTGAHAGALLGDVKHDPLQSGGLGTPAHLRVVSGLIHKAHKGVLFIDEVATLGRSQQDLLTALQEKQLPITGRSEMSSGAMVMTDPVPCDFILIAAGNVNVIQLMHPALRSRIRGYGYEVYMDDMISDSEEHRKKLVQFVAQEVSRDKKIPHFTKDAVGEIIREAKRKAGMRDRMTLRFRELGGLIRASGDIARENRHKYVTIEDVLEGKKAARTLEQQIGDVYLDRKKEYNVLITKGGRVGRVNGLAVLGDGGTVLPIEAEVAPGGKKAEIIATGKLGDIAKEAVQNVAAVIMKIYGEDIKEKYDIFVQFLQTYEGVEGDSASVSVAVAVISAFKNVEIDQSVAMTGSLTVRGEVLPVGGVTQKIEAAIDAGMKRVIIPKGNEKDVLLEKKYKGKIEIKTADTITDVLKDSLIGGGEIIRQMSKITT
jgi:Lon-like ATP-dependent protease